MNILIITGGSLSKEFVTSYISKKKYDLLIVADNGLKIADELNLKIDHIVGDFDTVNKDLLKKYTNKNVTIHTYPTDKNYTDTHLAVKLACSLTAKNISILGATGTRLDHTISNIHILKELLRKNINCKIIDLNNEIQITNKNIKILKENYKYLSLIPLTQKVTGISLRGLKYSLNNYEMKIEQSIGISNEIIADVAEIDLEKGILLVIKSKD